MIVFEPILRRRTIGMKRLLHQGEIEPPVWHSICLTKVPIRSACQIGKGGGRSIMPALETGRNGMSRVSSRVFDVRDDASVRS